MNNNENSTASKGKTYITTVLEAFGQFISKEYRICTIRNIPIKITTPWILIAVILIHDFSSEFTVAEYGFNTVFVLSIYSSVLLHEFGHVLAAYRNGIETKNIKLWILGGVAHIKMYSLSAREEFEIAVAGPLVSVFLGVTLGTTSIYGIYTGWPLSITAFLGTLAIVNLFVVTFNLLPIFPLDGGRITRSIFKYVFGDLNGTTYATYLSKVGAVCCGGYAILSGNALYILLGGFIYITSQKELQREKEETYRENISSIVSVSENSDIEVSNKTKQSNNALIQEVTSENTRVIAEQNDDDIVFINSNTVSDTTIQRLLSQEKTVIDTENMDITQ